MSSLAAILKGLGVEDYNNPETWATVIAASYSSSDGAPSQEIANSLTKLMGERKASFIDKYGTDEELSPTSAMHQFAEQQVNPEYMRRMVRNTQDYDNRAGLSGSYRTGYGEVERDNMLNQLERERKTMIDTSMGQQKDLFTDWYGKQMYEYQTSDDPSQFTLQAAGLGPEFGDLGWTNDPLPRPPQSQYHALDLRDRFKPQGRSGYGGGSDNLYGKISYY